MKARQGYSTVPVRPGRLENAKTVKLDLARARVIAAGGPSLRELSEKLGGWGVAEVSGRVKTGS